MWTVLVRLVASHVRNQQGGMRHSSCGIAGFTAKYNADVNARPANYLLGLAACAVENGALALPRRGRLGLGQEALPKATAFAAPALRGSVAAAHKFRVANAAELSGPPKPP